MEKKHRENKVVYAALICVLAVLSALVIITGMLSRREEKKPDENTVPIRDTVATDGIQDNNDIAPEQKPPKTQRNTDEAAMQPPRDITGPAIDENESESVMATDNIDADPVNAEPAMPEFTIPCEGAVSKPHSETSLVFSMTMNDYRTHTGVDIATVTGAEVRAAADGVVTEVWDDPLWSYCISINHEGDCTTVYRNLSSDSVLHMSSGDIVKIGDIIGNVGEGALIETADEPHLHFEMKIGGVNVDPCDYIEFPENDITNAE